MPYKFVIEGKPIAKQRPRFKRQGNMVMTYDTQTCDKNKIKTLLNQQLPFNRILRPLEQHISAQMTFHTAPPKKCSKKRLKSILGKPDKRRPDLDNLVKMYADAMNGLVYKDDNQITQLWCEKLYSNAPRVEIFITEIREDTMVNEHAITVKGEITLENLNYMTRKANRLGLSNRELVRVFAQEDDEGRHYYFECEGLKSDK